MAVPYVIIHVEYDKRVIKSTMSGVVEQPASTLVEHLPARQVVLGSNLIY